MWSLKSMDLPSTSKVFLLFLIYGSCFAVIFLSTIHLFYFIFPAVILSHFLFNLYCSCKFSSALIKKYGVRTSTYIEQREIILYSVRFTRNASIISNLLQTLSLSLFLLSYTIEMIYYLPILWSISCSIMTMTFIQNRHFMRSNCLRLPICKCFNQ